MNKGKMVGRSIFTVLFIAGLAVYSAANFWGARDSLAEISASRPEDFAAAVDAIDSVVTEEVLGRYPIVESYGVLQQLMQKRETGNFDLVLDKDGYLHGGNFWVGFEEDPQEMAVRVRRLLDSLEAKGTHAGFVLMPMKTPREEAKFPGVPYNDFTGHAEDMLRWLRYYSVPVLDMREVLDDTSLVYEDIYFRTDHHWSPRAAFYGFCGLTEWMNLRWDARLDEDRYYRNIENYELRMYPAYMLGSQGRDAGQLYAGGLEDFEVLIPKTEGDFFRLHGEREKRLEEEEGGFTATLMDLSPEGDIYSSRAGRIYLDEIEAYEHIENRGNPGGPRILLLRDSYASPMAAFLSQICGQLDMLWIREYQSGEVEALLEENDYDFVLIALYPENLTLTNFPYHESEAAS